MKYEITIEGKFTYYCEVEADNIKEAKEKAVKDFEDYDSTYLEFDWPNLEFSNGKLPF